MIGISPLLCVGGEGHGRNQRYGPDKSGGQKREKKKKKKKKKKK